MRFVMTGHEGLIGNSLLKKLEERGDKAVLLVDKRSGKDIKDINDFEIDDEVDVFIHLAAFCKICDTIGDPGRAFDNNVLGMFKVLEFCRRNKIPKIVFTSSSRILSSKKNPYTSSKIYGEELVKAYSECYGIDYVIVRPSTVYGPFNDKTKRLVDIFILNALQGKDLVITREKDSTLDFTYVDDFVEGYLIAMEQKNKEFDLSYGMGVEVGRVADMIIGMAGKGRKVFKEVAISQPQKVELDISAIRELGYDPKIGIEEGLRRTFEWYKENLVELLDSRRELKDSNDL